MSSRCLRRDEEDTYEKKLVVDTESSHHQMDVSGNSNASLAKSAQQVNSLYSSSSVEKKTHHSRHIFEDDNVSEPATEMYSLEDLPRIKALNDEEVHSIDSALLSAEEQDLVESSSLEDLHSHHSRHSKTPNSMMVGHHHHSGGGYHHQQHHHQSDMDSRKISSAKKISAVRAARGLSSSATNGYTSRSEDVSSRPSSRSDRRIHIVNQYDARSRGNTPTTLRRNVSAFGEITVMPVGNNEDEDLKIAVDEHIYR